MKKAAAVVFLIFFFACSAEMQQKPEDIWSEEKFVNAMVEIQMTEAYIRLGFNRSQVSYRHQDSLYNSVFRELGVEAEEFKRNLDYYSQEPKQMEKIYTKVIERLSEKQAELQGQEQQEEIQQEQE